LQCGRHLYGTVGQHSGRSVGRFSARLSALNHQNAHASFVQSNRERKSNDAATNDDHVPSLHVNIVEESACASFATVHT
jgi:hypothetical protein